MSIDYDRLTPLPPAIAKAPDVSVGHDRWSRPTGIGSGPSRSLAHPQKERSVDGARTLAQCNGGSGAAPLAREAVRAGVPLKPAMRKQRRRIPKALSLTVVGLLLIVVLVLAGCGGDDDERGAEGRSDGQAQLAGTPLFGGSLEPGQRYRTRAFQPGLSFVVQDGDWFARETQSRTLVVLDGSTLPHRPMFLAFQRYRRVYDPDRPGHGSASAVPVPRDFIAWLLSHPDLAASQPSPIRVAGFRGRQLDAVFTTGKPRHRHNSPECREYCVALAPDAWFGQGWKVRFIVIESDRETAVITVEALPRDFARFSARALRVLETMRLAQAP